MTPSKVKTLLDNGVLQAFAAGKQLQFRFKDSKSTWSTIDSEAPGVRNFFDPYIEWRVAPEKKTGWVVVLNYISCDGMPLVGGSCIYASKELAILAWKNDFKRVVAITEIVYEEGEGL